MERYILRWFVHVERINDEKIAKRVCESGVGGNQGRGRPNRVWMDGVRRVLNDRGLILEQARMNVHDRAKRREFLNVGPCRRKDDI